jgi:F-type H+-transporting ATPase subunit epsilon
MASTVRFKLVTPTEVVFDGDAELVIAVTTEGEEGILPRHAPFLAALKPGVLRANVVQNSLSPSERSERSPERSVAESKGSRLELATSEGFMQAFPERITVLVDQAVRFEDVVVAEARNALTEATERQKAVPVGSEQYAREQAIIEFANAKLRLTGHR